MYIFNLTQSTNKTPYTNAQWVKNLFAMQEIQRHGFDQSLIQEDPLEEEMATCSSILIWRNPWTEEPGGLHTVRGVSKSWTQLSD